MEPVKLSTFTCAEPRSRSPQAPTDQRACSLAAATPRTPRSIEETASQVVFQNVDLFVLIAENITQTSTLLHLFEACGTGRQAVKQLPKAMIIALLNTLPLEIRQMAVAMLAFDSTKFSDYAERARFVDTYLGHSDELLPILFDPIEAFTKLRDVAATVETFTPLYISSCMETLETIEAIRLASDPHYLPHDYDIHNTPCWRWSGDEAKEISYDKECDPTGDPTRRAYLARLTDTPHPWTFPVHHIERYRIQRAFWRFELFCRLFPEHPTMEMGNDADLHVHRRVYLARIQKWDFEELTSVVPFLFRVLERIYDPGVSRDLAHHVKRSGLQWKSFLAQARAREAVGWNEPKPRDWENEFFGVYRGSVESARLSRIDPNGNSTAQLSHQKWLAHQVSRGLRHILACHQQYVCDGCEVFSNKYPTQSYAPSQFYYAPIEALLEWYYVWFRYVGSDEFHHMYDASRHSRRWEDMPDACSPSYYWNLRYSGYTALQGLKLRDVGYVFWDFRNKN